MMRYIFAPIVVAILLQAPQASTPELADLTPQK